MPIVSTFTVYDPTMLNSLYYTNAEFVNYNPLIVRFITPFKVTKDVDSKSLIIAYAYLD